MADIHVRLTDPQDIPAIAVLRAQWTGASSDARFERRVREWLAAEGERRLVFLATLAGAPAGMASMLEYHRMPRPDRLRSRWGYVGNMFVREELRDRGIGSALLAAIILESEARDYARLVLSPTERAVPFYERAGFVVADASAGGDRMMVRVPQAATAANSAKTAR
jgi:GNAT superfamily N-acetyltransferase